VAIIRLCRGAYLRAQDLDALPVLINGDDILFQGDDRFYAIWRSTIAEFGLKLSVGKNYFSPQFLTVNSELYVFETEPEKIERPWWGGLLPDFYRARTQIKRKFGLDVLTCDPRLVLSRVQDKFLASVPQDLRGLANNIWHRQMLGCGLLDQYSGLNWYIPVQYGGIGLDSTGRTSLRVTEAQRRLAVRLALDRGKGPPNLSAEGSLPSAGVRRAIEGNLPTRRVTGTLISFGGRDVVDTGRVRQIYHVGRDGLVEASIRPELLETVDSFVSRSNAIYTWLDYHTMGVRMDPERIRRGVRDMLHWGMKISVKRVDELFDQLDQRPIYRVVDRLLT